MRIEPLVPVPKDDGLDAEEVEAARGELRYPAVVQVPLQVLDDFRVVAERETRALVEEAERRLRVGVGRRNAKPVAVERRAGALRRIVGHHLPLDDLVRA